MMTQENIPYTADEIKAMVKTIEELRKKYNDALERASKLKVQNPFDTVGQMVEHIFPELKESEDGENKRISKEITKFLKQNNGWNREWLAWLEKQGKQHPHVDVNKMVDKFAHTEVKGYGVPSMIEVDAYRKGIEDAFEKQGEQEPYGQRKECGDCQFNYAGECKGFCQMKRDEQKPVDKVEPKFKVGDWLQYRYAEPFLVEEITEQGYCNGNSCLPFEWEDEIHLWTIDDAKRGDVLVDAYGNIGMFDKCYDFDWMSFCSLGNNGGFQYFTVEHENEKTHPATKEKRDEVFAKMKEAGYEWDGEKKELKKIESKTLDADKVIEWFRKNTCTACWDRPDTAISQRIERFKKDFKL